tara:strand:+ start:2725 stop:3339 length:615 start_codon:yes stop_codon:yes gene_type:complete
MCPILRTLYFIGGHGVHGVRLGFVCGGKFCVWEVEGKLKLSSQASDLQRKGRDCDYRCDGSKRETHRSCVRFENKELWRVVAVLYVNVKVKSGGTGKRALTRLGTMSANTEASPKNTRWQNHSAWSRIINHPHDMTLYTMKRQLIIKNTVRNILARQRTPQPSQPFAVLPVVLSNGASSLTVNIAPITITVDKTHLFAAFAHSC